MNRFTPDNFTDKELSWSYWYVTHRFFVRKILFTFLCVLTGIFFCILSYKVLDVYFFTSAEYQQGIASLKSTHLALAELRFEGDRAIQEIQILDTLVLPGNSTGRYDFFSSIGNLNTQYVAYFKYRFNADGMETPWRKSFLLPGSSRFVHELTFSSENFLSSAVIEISDVQWNHVVSYEKAVAEKLRFVINDPEFVSSQENEAGDMVGSRITFTVENQSAYNYRSVGFFALLYQGPQIVGVTRLVQENMFANSVTLITIPWYAGKENISRVEIFPEIDILDMKVFF